MNSDQHQECRYVGWFVERPACGKTLSARIHRIRIIIQLVPPMQNLCCVALSNRTWSDLEIVNYCIVEIMMAEIYVNFIPSVHT